MLNLTFNPRLAWLITTWCRFVALILQLGGQKKHGHAAHTQGACSPTCCGESPRALGQKVPLGDQKTLILDPSAKLLWSCGSGFLVLCNSKVMPWVFTRTPTERGSLSPCPPFAFDGWNRFFFFFKNLRKSWRYGTVGAVKTCNHYSSRRTDSSFVRRADVEFDFQPQTCMVNHYLISVCCIDFAAWRAEEAWPRSAHTGSLLPYMLRGKSPCLGAESATGRPEDLDPGSFSEAFVELWFWVLVLCNSKVMPWVFTRTPTERGSLSPCPPFAFDGCNRCFILGRKIWDSGRSRDRKNYSSRRTDSSIVGFDASHGWVPTCRCWIWLSTPDLHG